MGPVIKAVNFIRARGLNHWQFQKFLDDPDIEHQNLTYFSKVRWLSKGSVLRQFYELRKEVALFLKNKGRPMAEMEDESWLCDLAFFIDITTHMNELNTRLQQKVQYVSEMYGHIKDFMNQLRLWHAHEQVETLASNDIQMELIDLQERADLNAKYVKMNLGDFYRKYLDQDKFPNLKKFYGF